MDRDDRVVTVRDSARGMAVVALIVAIAALTLAWMAYNRTGADLEDRIAEQVQNATDATERGLDTGPDGVDDGTE